MKSEGIHLNDEFEYHVWSNAIKYTIQSVKKAILTIYKSIKSQG